MTARTLVLGTFLLAALVAVPMAGALPYCGELYTCSVPPREYCDTQCLECTGISSGPEDSGPGEPGYPYAGNCENPTVVQVGDIGCPCLERSSAQVGPADLESFLQMLAATPTPALGTAVESTHGDF